MAKGFPSSFVKAVTSKRCTTCLIAVLTLMLGLLGNKSAQATTGIGPYEVPQVVDSNADPSIVETYIVADEATVDIGNGVTANAVTFRSCSNDGLTTCTAAAIPGPELRLKVGDTVIVHFKNQLAHATGIHWHGVELDNRSDGTPLTQNQVGPGETFVYKFKVTRPGVFWYHPHHHSSTNQVFQGLYGSLIVEDPYEGQLRNMGVIPSTAQTKTLVLSDITVCKTQGTNDSATYDTSTLPHVSGTWGGNNNGPSPKSLCETNPINEHGGPGSAFGGGDVPNIVTSNPGPVGEGQTVLTNGVNVGARAGTPNKPGALATGAQTLDVQAGRGLRLQIINAAATRFVRLHLTDSRGNNIPLVRIGGQGGLLDKAVVEGGVIAGFDFKYNAGEILIPPGSREDVVAAIPVRAISSDVLTLWTEDFERTGAEYAWIPTVPVMHLKVVGVAAPAYSISGGTLLRERFGAQAKVEVLPNEGVSMGSLLPPPDGLPGLTNGDIKLTNRTTTPNVAGFPSVDGIQGAHDFGDLYEDPANEAPHMASARYARLGDTLELTVTNVTGAHHPFHLHGFSIQAISLTDTLPNPPGHGPNASPGIGPSYEFPYKEFRDEIDIPGGYTLKFRVRLDDRPKFPNAGSEEARGGGLGRWFFHCHVLFHAHLGMLSELDVLPPN